MPKFRVCSYCGRDIEPGTGHMYVTAKGDIIWLCSSKCRRNMLYLRRKASEQAWVLKGSQR